MAGRGRARLKWTRPGSSTWCMLMLHAKMLDKAIEWWRIRNIVPSSHGYVHQWCKVLNCIPLLAGCREGYTDISKGGVGHSLSAH